MTKYKKIVKKPHKCDCIIISLVNLLGLDLDSR